MAALTAELEILPIIIDAIKDATARDMTNKDSKEIKALGCSHAIIHKIRGC
jgi:hypothetical protein